MDKVYTTKIAYDQGYRVQKDGSVTLFNKPINKILRYKNRICICKNCLKEKRNNTHEYIQRFKDKCICCGESDVACLDFHHLNDKYESLSHMNSHSTDTINKEINKCVILCANCHRKLHYYKCNIDELKNKIHDRLQ